MVIPRPRGEFEQLSEDEYTFNLLYGFVSNDSLNYVDSLGQGLVQWILTGEWNPPQEVANEAARGWAEGLWGGISLPLYTGKANPTNDEWNAAMDAAGKYVNCYNQCIANANQKGLAAISGAMGALPFTSIPKSIIPQFIMKGRVGQGAGSSSYTSIMRVISLIAGKVLGEKSFLTKMLNSAAKSVKAATKAGPLKAIAKGSVAGIAVAETGIAIYCANKCKCCK